jgi:hypothetical protein
MYGSEELGDVVCEVLSLTGGLGPGLAPHDRALVHRHFGTTSRYEWMFWEMAYHKQGRPAWGRARWLLAPCQPVNGSSKWLKSQVFCTMPEQVLSSRSPGQPPLSRWIAQSDRKFMPFCWAKVSTVWASVR